MNATPATTTTTSPGLMKPRPYRRPEDDSDELPKVAVKDRRTFTPEQDDDTNLSPEDATWKKRYGDLRSYSARKEKEFKDRITELEQAVARMQAGTPKALPKSADEVRDWAENNPEAYALVKTIAVHENSETIEALQKQIDALQTKLMLSDADRAEAQLTALHPDWKDINADEEFHDWMKTRSQAIQNIIYNSADPFAIADVLTTYKQAKGIGVSQDKPKARKQQTVDAALTVAPARTEGPDHGSDNGKIRESWIKSLSPEEFEKEEERIMEAYNTGKVIFDVKRPHFPTS